MNHNGIPVYHSNEAVLTMFRHPQRHPWQRAEVKCAFSVNACHVVPASPDGYWRQRSSHLLEHSKHVPLGLDTSQMRLTPRPDGSAKSSGVINAAAIGLHFSPSFLGCFSLFSLLVSRNHLHSNGLYGDFLGRPRHARRKRD